MFELYSAIWRKTRRQQIQVIFLSLAIAGLAAVPLDYQKKIINGMTEGADFNDLLSLGLQMSVVILLSLVLKWWLGYKMGIVGEWVIRFIRTSKVEDWLAWPEPEEVESQKGTLANVVSSESEAIGKFVGSAFAEPLLQGGILVSVIGYITWSQPVLGLIVGCMIIPQVFVVVYTQNRVNALVRERVLILRRSINSITESDLELVKKSLFDDFDRLYEARRSIFIWKLSVKLFLGIINGAGLVIVLVYGGWSVTEGLIDVGSVVAATIGLGRIQRPLKDLIDFFRNMSIVYVQFELLKNLRLQG